MRLARACRFPKVSRAILPSLADLPDRRLQLDGGAVGILDVDRGAGAFGAVARAGFDDGDAMRREMAAQEILVPGGEAQAEMVEVVALGAGARAAGAAELAVE